MSPITKHKCDQCGKEVTDYYAELGWIHVDARSISGFNVTVSRGRDANHQASTYFTTVLPGGELDFCGWDCMRKYLERNKGAE